MMGLKKDVILRSPQRGRLEGRILVIQLVDGCIRSDAISGGETKR